MRGFREILVPIDLSDPPESALECASMIAGSYQAKIDLIYVWQVPSPEPLTPPLLGDENLSLWQLAERDAQRSLAAFAAERAARGIRIRSSTAVNGTPGPAIVDAAKQGGYGLVVMGTHGRRGLGRVLLGSVAEHVLRHASCPVLTVRVTETRQGSA